MQFKIPQNIDVEDKIIAFISFKQLFILLGGGAVSYVIYTVSVGRVPAYAYIIPIAFILAITALIAFLKVDNLTFPRMVLLFLERIINPSQRVWRHFSTIPTLLDEYEELLKNTAGTKKVLVQDNPAGSIKSLNSIADIVDMQTSPESDSSTPQ